MLALTLHPLKVSHDGWRQIHRGKEVSHYFTQNKRIFKQFGRFLCGFYTICGKKSISTERETEAAL